MSANEQRYPVGMYVDGISTSGDVRLKVRGHHKDGVIVEVVDRYVDTANDVTYEPGEVFVVDSLNIIESEYNKGIIEAAPLGTWCTEWRGEKQIPVHKRLDGETELELSFYHGQEDGKPVIQIDGEADFRINVNDGPIWDQSTEQGRKVWVATVSDDNDSPGPAVYVADTQEGLIRVMYAQQGIPTNDDILDWMELHGKTAVWDSYYIEGE